MTERRFYVADAEFTGDIRLPEDQSRHLSRVLRLKTGDDVRVFNGRGRECVYRVKETGKDSVNLEFVCESEAPAAESPLKLTLAVPILKKSNTELVLQKAVELGVTRFVPLITKRTEVSARHWKPDRAMKIAAEAAKQCGRAVVPTLAEPSPFEEFIASQAGDRFLFFEGDGGKLPPSLETDEVIAVTGPEGGWDASEVETAERSGFQIIHLGGRILRAETAPIVAVSLLQFAYGDLG